MKILHVVRQYLPGTGGMETYVSSLCRELSARGHDADVATLDYIFYTDGRLPAYEIIAGTDVFRLPSYGNPRYFIAPKVLDLLPRYDLVHVHGLDFFADFIGVRRGAHNKPVVLSTHGGFFHTSWIPGLKRLYFKTVTRLALTGVDRVLASSPKDEELFRRISNRVTLVNNGVDFARFASLEKHVESDGLIFIGRLSKNKGISRLLEVFAHLRQARPAARLTVVGPDWEGLMAGFKQRAAELGVGEAVRFTGALGEEELAAELAAAKLFVSASEYEAFGISTVEAMASGTVPVVSDIQAFRDLIEPGVSGFLTDFSNAAAAAETLERALALPDDELAATAARARESAARYDWSIVSEQITSIYEEVIASHA